MAEINFKNHIKNYFNFLYSNLKAKTNIDQCLKYTQQLHKRVKNQFVLYGGETPQEEEFKNIINKYVEIKKDYDKPFNTLSTSKPDIYDQDTNQLKSDIYDQDTQQLKPNLTPEQYARIFDILDPTNNVLIPRQNLDNFIEKLKLLSDYTNISLEYIFKYQPNKGELSEYVNGLDTENLKKLYSELDEFIKNISKLAEVKGTTVPDVAPTVVPVSSTA